MKNLLTAILLFSSVGAYGEDTMFLNCTHIPGSGSWYIGRTIILDNTQWDEIFLIAEIDLEATLNEAWIERNQSIMNGKMRPNEVDMFSDAYFLRYWDERRLRYRIDRSTGELSEYDHKYDLSVLAQCLPATRSDVQAILQDEIDRRDAIIAANEEKRLF